jgi:hypothetical protein
LGYSTHKPFSAAQVPGTCKHVAMLARTRFSIISTGLLCLPTSLNDPRLVASLPPRHLVCVKRIIQRCRNLHLLSIAYALQPRLRPDSPAADQPCSGSLGFSAVGVLAPRIVTYPDIRTRLRSPPACADGSRLDDAPLPLSDCIAVLNPALRYVV